MGKLVLDLSVTNMSFRNLLCLSEEESAAASFVTALSGSGTTEDFFCLVPFLVGSADGLERGGRRGAHMGRLYM